MSHDDVVDLISRNTVPVALNLYEVRARKTAAGEFFRGVQKQKPAQYQGLYLVSADGKVLASHQQYKSGKTWARELIADIEPGLRAFGEIKPREFVRGDPLPLRGVGRHDDGSVTLAIYLRTSIRGIPLREVPNPTIDSLTLTPKDFGEFVPPRFELGAKWKLSEGLSRKFSKLLGPSNEDSMPRPGEVTAFNITAHLERGEDGVAIIVYQGTLAGGHLNAAKKQTRGEVNLVGVGRCHVRTGQMLSLVWIADGTYNGPPPYDQPTAYSGVVEWVRDRKK